MRAAVITISDRVSRGDAVDTSGPALQAALERLGFDDVVVTVVPDGIEVVAEALRDFVDSVSLVATTGGTGFAARDLTPEATRRVIEREAPGLAEAMRAETFGVNPHGMLSRGVCGIAGSTLIVNLPGSLKGATESLNVIAPALRHGVELLSVPESDHNAG